MRRSLPALARATRAALLLTLALAAGGCSTVRGWFDADAGRPSAQSGAAPNAAAPAPAAASAPAGPAAYALEIEAPDDLRPLLDTHLDLARFRALPPPGSGATPGVPGVMSPSAAATAPEPADAAPAPAPTATAVESAASAADATPPAGITRLELDRLIMAAPAQARALLETEGYFDARVTAERDEAMPPRVKLSVVPGPRVTVDRVDIEVEGALVDAGAKGDAEARATLDALRQRWSLPAGQPFRQSTWTDAKAAALTTLRTEGYPRAVWTETLARIDPVTRRASLTLSAQSGPQIRLGAVRVRGLKRYGREAVVNLRTFSNGQLYRESLLADYQERLTKAGLFESASVTLDLDGARGGTEAPVEVRVRELPTQQAQTGIGISANTGPRVSLAHVDRRVFGWNATSSNTFEIGRDEQKWTGQIISHPHPRQFRDLVSAQIDRLDTAGQIVESWRLRAGQSQERERSERLYFGELLGATTVTDGVRDSATAASANINWITRHVDDVLLPTRGYILSTELAAGYAFNSNEHNGVFGRVLGRGIGYLPLGENWYSQVRIEAAQILSKSDIGLPDPLLFRAGGDDSVRGYGYRTLGPTVDGVLSSGRYLFTSSVELARPLVARLPSVWGAVFVDAGNAANSWGALQPALGYGVGVRWRSPIGPLRVDLAYGQEVHRVRLHLSVGIAL